MDVARFKKCNRIVMLEQVLILLPVQRYISTDYINTVMGFIEIPEWILLTFGKGRPFFERISLHKTSAWYDIHGHATRLPSRFAKNDPDLGPGSLHHGD